jgi:hypothetical protein
MLQIGMRTMADDSQQDASSPADAGRSKRAPPTIELEATDVTTAPKVEATEPVTEQGDTKPQADPAPEQPAAEQPAASAAAASAPPRSSGISPWVIAPFSGAVAAALVIGIGWMLGWPEVQAPPAEPQVSASAVNDLGARVASLEAKAGKPIADPALAARADALEKSVTALRGDVGNLRAQTDKLAAAIDALKSAPRDASGNVDLSGINDRIARLEQATSAQGAAIEKAGEKAADAKPADDLPLRRLVAASLLDVAARHGDPFKSTLAAAKSLSPEPDALKPLDQFAATGVPSPQMLGRELLNLVPKFPQSSQAAAPSGGGILDRLQAGAEKLVQIERTDAVGNDRRAVIARATAAALRNDIVEARRELGTLSPEDRAPAQAWLDKVTARDAALSASRQFADSAMAALGNPGQ